jgi:hypothetical protein
MAPAHAVLGLALLARLVVADDTDDDASSSIFIDPDSFPDTWCGALQLAQLFLAYCAILYIGCNMISDGAELLMLMPYSKLVGSVILPILGAVPDGAIVLFSGIGPDAQTNLDVGVGALAGSTVMLITIPSTAASDLLHRARRRRLTGPHTGGSWPSTAAASISTSMGSPSTGASPD